MAVTVDQLGVALRIITTGSVEEPQLSILTRLLGMAVATVEKVAPEAPTELKDQAVIQLAAYTFDRPLSPGGTGYANAFRNSGAQHILYRWIRRTTGISEAVAE